MQTTFFRRPRRQAARLQAAIFAVSGIVGLSAMASAQPAAAATIVQQFSAIDDYMISTTSDSTLTYWAPAPIFTVTPFSASLGSLVSTTITWLTSYAVTGEVGSAADTGNAYAGYGGGLFVNDSNYNGYGNGAGDGGLTGYTLAITAGPSEVTDTFLSAEAGTLYDPSILDAFLGMNPYSISYINPDGLDSTPYFVNYTNLLGGAATATSSATVTYEYIPGSNIPVPGPLPLIGAGAAWTWSRTLRRRVR
jgi:hypothetical protein